MKRVKAFTGNVVFLLLLSVTLAVLAVRVSSAARGEPALYFGRGFTMTMSESMEPTIMTGAVTTFEPQDAYQVGDVVVFRNRDFGKGNAYICHRIVNIEDGLMTTKGDNNRTLDPYQTPLDAVDGKIVAVYNWTAGAGRMVLLAGAAILGVAGTAIYMRKKK